jgi:hypothetical protein
MKWASRLELILKKLVNAALGGDPKSADDLFALRAQAERNNGARIEEIIAEGWIPDFPGQTGEQKTRAHAGDGEIDPIAFWEPGSEATDPAGSGQVPPRRNLPGMNEPSDQLHLNLQSNLSIT